jgi:hypothetical protein
MTATCCYQYAKRSYSLDAFKTWVAKHGLVGVQNQICLTAQGKAVRLQTLLTEVIDSERNLGGLSANMI